jgi:hypothetical protein
MLFDFFWLLNLLWHICIINLIRLIRLIGLLRFTKTLTFLFLDLDAPLLKNLWQRQISICVEVVFD